MSRLLKNQSFTLALIAAVALAFAFPQWGAAKGPLQANIISKLGIMLIFFLQGLALPTHELRTGLRDWRLQGFILLWIFVGNALLLGGIAGLLLLGGQRDLAAGFAYLALLPTTISSAVALTASAGGRVAVSLFGTTVSNIIGVFWVPLGCVLIFAADGTPLIQIVVPLLLKLAVLILLPMAAGRGLHPFTHRSPHYRRVQPFFRHINNGIIAFIVFTAFSQSILEDAWQRVPGASLLLLLVAVVAAIGTLHALVWLSSGKLDCGYPSRIAVLYTASQKTLATGVPMALLIFSNEDLHSSINLGLLLLPLMCFHPLQLLLGAMLAPHLNRKLP